MLGLIEAGIDAVVQGLKLANTKAVPTLVARLDSLKHQRLEEKQKGQLADDLLIHRIDAELKITFESAQQEIMRALATK